ncbi:MAG TPA: FG-GAP-like repeat-containing protein, partial [Steroidobacteraceae bacterium]
GKLLWTADGAPGDELGSGVEGIGDANGDGIPDVAASGPSAAGVAYIYSGRDGHILQTFKSTRRDELFGNHISGAGDVNGDGHADLIIGAPGKPGEHSNSGHAYVYSGKDGTLLYTLSGERPGDEFGSAVAGYSNGTHHLLVVGAPRAGPQHRGRVYVYKHYSGKPRFTIDADATGNALGAMFVSVMGDTDGDGTHDIFVSDWSNAAKGASTGRIYVHSGRTGARLLTLTGESSGDGFGTSKSTAGDVDGDGHADLIVGAWQYAGAAISGGRAYLYSGKDGRLVKTFTCKTPGDTFGFDAVGLGDVDGDGTADLLITSGWSGVAGYHSGRVFIISSGVPAAKLAK